MTGEYFMGVGWEGNYFRMIFLGGAVKSSKSVFFEKKKKGKHD